ncbi:GspH/FimT family pseudopilin [Colwellia sp. TT2012]|uniref:GspH/FimT family pseudopilin n=1 Tax=Colwellia sp. TT2012 TaxID=1720342 RepID=UPI00070C67A2|nr:GspH/FimT family pseudopilin [Colwellia sp. TT2012]
MEQFNPQSAKIKHITKLTKGFNLVELMITIAIAGILSMIALPSFNELLTRMRVDNEISEIQRLLLTARNMAINTGKNTTVCPINAVGACTTNWQDEISVFTNNVNTLANSNVFAANDELVKIKAAVKSGDTLQYAQTSVIYTPAGRLLTIAASFIYCPQSGAGRGITVSLSGRSYTSSDTDNDGIEEDRTGADVICP